MKINKPIKGNSKAIKRFNSWFEKKQEEGLLYIHLSLSLEDNAFFGKKHFMRHFPKWIRNIYSKRYLDKILNSFMDAEKAIENGEVYEEHFFGDSSK